MGNSTIRDNSTVLCPAPYRMLLVRVHTVPDGTYVEWFNVVAILASTTGSGNQIETVISPITIGGNEENYNPIRITGVRDNDDGLVHTIIVPATWDPIDDKSNAIRVGKELIDNIGHCMDIADVEQSIIMESEPLKQ